MRLYHHPLSSNARRVLLTADQLGVPLELMMVDLLQEAERNRLHEVNPNGKLPVLEDGDFVLWESCAIMQYLADLQPGNTLYPAAPRVRADINRWLFWACQHFSATVAVLSFERLWKGMVGMGEGDPVLEAGAERELHALCAVLEAHLAGRDWLVGDGLTLADFAVAPPLMYLEQARLPVTGYPNVMAWFGRVQALPAWENTQ